MGEGVLSGKQSALYPVLRNLEGAGLLESHVEPSSSGPPRRYYRINERGREVLAQWRQAWQATRDSVDSVLEGTAMNDPSLAGRALPTTIPQYLAQLRGRWKAPTRRWCRTRCMTPRNTCARSWRRSRPAKPR